MPKSKNRENSNSANRHGLELHAGLGFRIRRMQQAVDVKLVQRLGAFSTPDIADRMNQLYVMSPKIRPCTSASSLAGTVCTVRVGSGDNLMVHKALDVALPGQIIVIDTAGEGHWAVLGELVAAKAVHRNILGFVVDGYIRDVSGIQELGLPVFARGSSAIGPTKRGPGEINFPVCCGGVVVNPGDILVADENGVAVIPSSSAQALASNLESNIETVESYRMSVRRGDYSLDWVERILALYPGVEEEDSR